MIVSDLREFNFTLEEFLNDKNSVISRAIEYLNGKYSKAEVADCLYSLFLKKRQEHIVWEKVVLPITDGDRISCSVDGELYSGIVHLKPKSIEVSVIINGERRSKCSELLEYAPVIYTETPFDGSPANDLAIMKAKSIILDLIYMKNT